MNLGPDLGTFASGNSIAWNLNPNGGTGPYTFTAADAAAPGPGDRDRQRAFRERFERRMCWAATPMVSGTYTFPATGG